MSDQEPPNLVLEQLTALRGDIAEVRSDTRDIKSRVNDMAIGFDTLRRDQASDAGVVAAMQARIDRLADDLDRVKRRLALADG